MIVNVYADTFRNEKIGRETGYFLELKKTDNSIWSLRQVSEKELGESKPESLASLSDRLNVLINKKVDQKKTQFRMAYENNGLPIEGKYDKIETDITKVMTSLIALSDKVQDVRNSYCIFSQIVQTLGNTLPIPLRGRIDFADQSNGTNYLKTRRLCPTPSKASGCTSLMPFLKNTLLERFKGRSYVNTRKITERLTLMLTAFAKTIITVFKTVISPFVAVYKIYRSWNSIAWNNKRWMVLDISFTLIVMSPLLNTAENIKFLLGAIISPDICIGDL